MISTSPELLVSSMGGVATTAVLEFLDAEVGASVNPPRGFQNPLKHALTPPRLASIRKAMFLFGDPRDSLLSLFRRGRSALQLVNVRGLFPAGFRYPERDPWSETVARFGLRESDREGLWVDGEGRYASEIGALEWLEQRKATRALEVDAAWRLVEELAGPALNDVAAYLAGGVDALGWTEQLRAWTTAERPYPRLLVRYEALWDHLEEVLDFLDVPAPSRARFPEWQPRRSRWREEPRALRHGQEALYGDLAEAIEAMPPVRLVEPSPQGRKS